MIRPTILALCLAAPAAAQTTQLTPPNAEINGRFGNAVAGVPDVNGDTRGDALVGAPFEDITGGFVNAGRAYLYTGITGALLRTFVSPSKEVHGEFGAAVAGFGDITGDGRGDVIIGAPKEDPGAAPDSAGRAYVFNGATGALVRVMKSPNEQIGGRFGSAVAFVPDVNGDGKPDLLVAAVGETVGGKAGAGRVYLYSGGTGVWLRTFSSPNGEVGGGFGASISGIPDINGDARGDIIIGAPNEDPGATPDNAGRVYIYNGATGALIRVYGSPNPEIDGGFGTSVTGIPDLNGDGRGDYAVGAPGESPGTSPARCGRVYVYNGATGVYLYTLAGSPQQTDARFGNSIAGVDDLTGDARGDLIVAAAAENPPAGFADAGRVFVYNGSTKALYNTLLSPNTEVGGMYGFAVAAVPDVNFNSRGDVLVGAPMEDPGTAPSNSGRAYIIRH